MILWFLHREIYMKFNYKGLTVLVISFAFWGDCIAETKIGIGTGATSSFSGYFGGVISVPIRLESNFLIEPFIGYTKRSEDADRTSPDYSLNDRESYQAGVGLYKLQKLGAEFELYYGAAVATGISIQTFESKSTYTSGGTTYSNYRKYKTDASEYMIKPTLGISYLVNENFSFSIDTGIYYYWGEEKRQENTTSTSALPPVYEESKYTADIDGFDTFTRFTFRMMF